MKSVQNWIDRLGHPPREVCLDWAWQLHREKTSADPDHDSALAIAWDDVSVGPDGQVEIREPASGACTKHLVRQLLEWASLESECDFPRSDPTADDALLQLTRMAMPSEATVGDSKSARPAKEAASPKQSDSPQKPSGALVGNEWTQPKRTPAPYGPKVSPRRDELGKSTQSAWWQRSSVRWLAAASVMLCTMFFLPWRSIFSAKPRDPGGETASVQQGSSAGDRAGSLTQTPGENAEVIGDFEFPEPGEAFAERVASAPQDMSQQALDSLQALSVDSASASTDAEDSRAAQLGSEDEVKSLVMPDEMATGGRDGKQVEGLELDSTEAMQTVEALDVASELNKLVAQASARVHEAQLSDSEAKQLEPMRVPTSPMLQTWKLPAKLGVRVREPMWSLRIQPSEGFQVKPEQTQQLSRRKQVSWVVEQEDASEDSAQVYVQAEIRGGGRSIRWKIGVGASHIPRLVLPMDSKYLEQMQLRLAGFESQLQYGIQQLKTISSVAGLPSELKSQLVARRRSLENQQAFASRVLGVVSEASQMSGWLDGQLEIHAVLNEAAAGQGSTPLLQFGLGSKSLDVPGDAEQAKQ